MHVQIDMSTLIQQESIEYQVHDLRTFVRDDVIRKSAMDLAEEVIEGVLRLPRDQRMVSAHLFITDYGAKLLLYAWVIEVIEIDNRLYCVFKSAVKGSNGTFYTYEVPILDLAGDDS